MRARRARDGAPARWIFTTAPGPARAEHRPSFERGLEYGRRPADVLAVAIAARGPGRGSAAAHPDLPDQRCGRQLGYERSVCYSGRSARGGSGRSAMTTRHGEWEPLPPPLPMATAPAAPAQPVGRPEVVGHWNWAAFGLTPIWALCHRIWWLAIVSLFCGFIPFVGLPLRSTPVSRVTSGRGRPPSNATRRRSTGASVTGRGPGGSC